MKPKTYFTKFLMMMKTNFGKVVSSFTQIMYSSMVIRILVVPRTCFCSSSNILSPKFQRTYPIFYQISILTSPLQSAILTITSSHCPTYLTSLESLRSLSKLRSLASLSILSALVVCRNCLLVPRSCRYGSCQHWLGIKGDCPNFSNAMYGMNGRGVGV